MRSVFVFLLLAAPCAADDFYIIVSDQIPPPVQYPPEVYKMNDAEFFKWATDFNKREEAAMDARRATMEPRWIDGTETKTSQGYTDYQTGLYGYLNYFGGWFGECNRGCGAAYSPFDGTIQTGTSNQKTTTYPVRRLNPQYTGPGPMVIVNPYCRPVK